ncbi:MAG: RhuM family protein, partial [Mariprofundaceae bacterium]|nr:RhuM family protein [Mariprofundaceae bacterium]
HQTLSMEAFSQSVDKFLSFNDFKVLDGFGSVSHQQAKQKAHREYDQFNTTQKITSDFDELNKKLRGKK